MINGFLHPQYLFSQYPYFVSPIEVASSQHFSADRQGSDQHFCSIKSIEMPFSRTNNGKVRLFPKAVGKSANTSCLDNSEKIISFCLELNSSDIPISERHGFH